MAPWNDFSGVIDPAEMYMTQLKFIFFVLGSRNFLKGNILQNYFIGKYPHPIPYLYFKQNKVEEF
jgi:hypothetical protein